MDKDALLYQIAFSRAKNINIGTAKVFAAKGISCRDFFMLGASELSALSGLKTEYFSDSKRHAILETAKRECDFVVRNNIKAVFYTDNAFPHRLLDCDDAPAMLYTLGNGFKEYSHVISVVGTRHCTYYGAEFCRQFIEELGQKIDDLLIVSGLAYGVDIAAHRAALSNNIATAAVFAHGLDTIYPAEHRNDARRIIENGGFIATEYTSSDKIHRGNFLARNRIVAGMADATIVVESNRKGGAMSTARIAGAYHRNVFAVPGRVSDIYSSGCNELIYNNEAEMLRGVDDLVHALNWTVRKPEGTQQELQLELSDDFKRILNYISGNPASTVNDMCVALEMPYSQLSSTLFEMEMADLIVAVPGGKYMPL